VQEQGILVGLVNHHWWPYYLTQQWNVSCTYQDKPLICQYVNIHSSNTNMTDEQRQQATARADGLMYHICPHEPRPAGAQPNAPVVVMTIESPGNNPCMSDPEIMKKGDIDMSYRSCSQVRVFPVVSCFQQPASSPRPAGNGCSPPVVGPVSTSSWVLLFKSMKLSHKQVSSIMTDRLTD
jgi:hypothetical protein